MLLKEVVEQHQSVPVQHETLNFPTFHFFNQLVDSFGDVLWVNIDKDAALVR